jgi:hypothetical protein
VGNLESVEYSDFERHPAHARQPDRRTADDRREAIRRGADRADRLREMVAFATALCGGLAILYFFFVLIGTIHIGEAVAATVVAIVLAAIWLFSFWRRTKTDARLAQRPDRERRGF